MREIAMSVAAAILEKNQENYETLYKDGKAFLQYPADWLIRFYNMALRDKRHGRALDYGCGSGNNAIFLMQKGYKVSGVDVAPSFKTLLRENLRLHNISETNAAFFSVIEPDATRLGFPDNYFDLIISNQVLYYMPNEDHLRKVVAELDRILAPGGIVFFTMMGPNNYYITDHAKGTSADGVVDVRVETPGHRLEGVHENILLIRDEAHLKSVFDKFDCLTTGYFDQSMFDMKSNFHWIFAGQKKA